MGKAIDEEYSEPQTDWKSGQRYSEMNLSLQLPLFYGRRERSGQKRKGRRKSLEGVEAALLLSTPPDTGHFSIRLPVLGVPKRQ